ncbi:MAG: protein kinase domain-containing protein [Nannocystales bacterium]
MAASPSSAVSVDLVDTVLADRYRVVKKLGEGGMGTVYLAEHTTINKRLAIKVLSPEFSHKQDLVDRFLQEARAASMIDQENVVEITDFGSTPGGSVFFVMEFLNGEDLSDTIKNTGPLPWARVKPIMLQIVEALKCAHEAGIVHRDMKPDNCFRIKRGSNSDFIKVLDFGIAKVTSDEGEGGGKNLTRTGMIFGTPEYMSPEQAKGEKVDHRVDVYALGIILYELLTGRVPFTADTFMGILTKHMFEPPAAPSTVAPSIDVPEQVEAIILKALQKDREYRFQSMEEMGAAIDKVGSGSAAVSVVDEVVALPAGGETSFKNRPVSDVYDDEEPVGSKTGMYVGIGLVAALLLGGAAFAASKMAGDDGADGTDAPQPDTVVAVSAGESAGAPPDSGNPKDPSAGDANDSAAAGADSLGADPDSGTPPPLGATTVSITVSTPGVEGTVYDNRDDSTLGKTNEPISMPLSSESFDVYVRAEGYEDFLTDVIPDKDKKVEVTLSKATSAVPVVTPPKRRKKGRTKGSKKKGTTAVSETPTKPEPTSHPPEKPPASAKKKKKKGNDISGDLKDPFGK